MRNAQSAASTDPHPLSGTVLSGADTIVQVLADEGVDTIFGYSGGAILPTYDAIFRYNEDNHDRMPLIVPANEQGAGFMAAGYARASGKVGVAMVTSGPGATNCVTPVRDCMADSVPIVLICGQVARAAVGTDAFQEAPVSNIMSSAAKHVFMVTDPDKLEATVRTAFEIARSGRPGPVVIDLPKDVCMALENFTPKEEIELKKYQPRLKPDEGLRKRLAPRVADPVPAQDELREVTVLGEEGVARVDGGRVALALEGRELGVVRVAQDQALAPRVEALPD